MQKPIFIVLLILSRKEFVMFQVRQYMQGEYGL